MYLVVIKYLEVAIKIDRIQHLCPDMLKKWITYVVDETHQLPIKIFISTAFLLLLCAQHRSFYAGAGPCLAPYSSGAMRAIDPQDDIKRYPLPSAIGLRRVWNAEAPGPMKLENCCRKIDEKVYFLIVFQKTHTFLSLLKNLLILSQNARKFISGFFI